MVVHHRRYLRRTIVNQWSHEQRGSTKFLFPSYICPLPRPFLPTIPPLPVHEPMWESVLPYIALDRGWWNLRIFEGIFAPTAKIYRRFIRQDKNYLSSLAEFSNVRWIHRFRIAQFMRLYPDATFDRRLWSLFSPSFLEVISITLLLFRDQFRWANSTEISCMRERETNRPNVIRHQLSL